MTKRDILVQKSKEIISQYTTRLTLRQIFYRLVSKHIISNTVSQYQYLSKILVKARLEGDIPFNSIEDRTREPKGGDRYEISPENYFRSRLSAIKNCWSWYSLPRWKDQPKYVEVWLEKEALSGLFSEITDRHNVVLSTCRGYPSLTFLYEASNRLRDVMEEGGKDIHIIYFGDLDPSGEDIFRNIQERLEYDFDIEANFEKVAITPQQIIDYNIPPMPSKKTDSRSASFIAKHGDRAVELDAIEPNTLQGLIDSAISKHFDSEIYDEVSKKEEKGQDRIKEMISEVFEGVGSHD